MKEPNEIADGMGDEDEFGDDLPGFDELPPSVIQGLATHPVNKVEMLGDEWIDDHVLCFNIRIHQDHQIVDVACLWAGADIYAAVQYWHDSPSAKQDFAEWLNRRIVDARTEQANEQQT